MNWQSPDRSERVATSALLGAAAGATIGIVGLVLFPPPPGSGASEVVLWLLRFALGAATGGALAGSLIGRLLPAMRDGIAAVIVGMAAVSLFLTTLLFATTGPDGVSLAQAVGLIAVAIVVGSAVGLFTKSIVQHGDPPDEAAEARRRELVWRILEVLRPRRWGRWSWKERRRRRIRSQPFPGDWRRHLENNVPFYRELSPGDREELEKQILVFLAEKNFEGVGGLELTDEIRVTIAAQAWLLTLHLDADYYPRLRSILVYPSTFVPKRPSLRPHWQDSDTDGAPLFGESWQWGIVIFSWDSVLDGAANMYDGQNVVFHEFAHQLDQEDSAADGIPILPVHSSYRTWARVLQQHFDEHASATNQGRRTVLDPYGADNPAEFFAVATEAFFETPRQLAARHPALYDELRRYYGQDPARRIGQRILRSSASTPSISVTSRAPPTFRVTRCIMRCVASPRAKREFMRMRFPRAFPALILLGSLGATGCADLLDPSDPGMDAVRVRLTVAPDTIEPGGSTDVEVVFRNLLDEELQIAFGAGCPFYLEAYRTAGDDRTKVELEGTTYLCTANITDMSIPAGDSVVVRQTIRAQVGPEPAPSGDYVVRAVFTTSIQALETSLHVR